MSKVHPSSGVGRERYYLTTAELNSTKFKLARLVMDYLQQLSMCDFNALHQVLIYKWRKRARFRFGDRWKPSRRSSIRAAMSESEKKELRSVWPTIILLAYIAITIKLIVLFVYQSEYDLNTFRLGRIRAKANGTGLVQNQSLCHSFGNWSRECQAELDCEEHIQSNYKALKFLGNPYLNILFCVQPAIIVSISVVAVCYMYPQLVVNYVDTVDLFLVDLLLNEEHEFTRCKAMIEHEVERVKNSSRNHVKAAAQLAYEELDQAAHRAHPTIGHAKLKVKDLTKCPKETSLARYERDDRLVREELDRMAASEQLHPINRTSVEWRGEIVGEFLKASLGNLVYSLIIDWILIYFGHQFSSLKLDFQSPMDYITLFEMGVYYQIGAFATSYHVPTFLLHCKNQTRYIKHVIARINSLMVTNERQFCLEALQSGTLSEQHYRSMNFRLLEAFLEYRIFLAQLTDFTTVWTKALKTGLMIMFFTPFIARIYEPYMLGVGGRTVSLLFSINTAIFADTLLVPVCNFEDKGNQLYRTMSSLLAHVRELNIQARRHFQGRSVYMENTVEMIRKELDEPEKMMDHFLTSIPGFQATFPRLLEVHFYYSVLNLALYCELDLWKNLLGDRLNDPFLILQD